jgi:hypothetical protein
MIESSGNYLVLAIESCFRGIGFRVFDLYQSFFRNVYISHKNLKDSIAQYFNHQTKAQ